jgi:nucleotide-binding universal stress UspA family protein
VEARLEGVAVEMVVRFGDPTAEILHEAEAFGADLIVLATTGRSALGRTMFGSVAEAVFRKAQVPVLLFHPGARGLAA